MNNFNTLLTYAIGFIGIIMETHGKNGLTDRLIQNSKSFKEKVLFNYYQVARGIIKTMKYPRCGIGGLKKIRSNEPYQKMTLKLIR